MKILHIPLKTPHDFQCETISWGLRGLNKVYGFNSIHRFGKNKYWKQIINSNYITIKDESCYDEIQSNIYTHCKKHLTCNNMVKYLLEHYD